MKKKTLWLCKHYKMSNYLITDQVPFWEKEEGPWSVEDWAKFDSFECLSHHWFSSVFPPEFFLEGGKESIKKIEVSYRKDSVTFKVAKK